MKTRQQKQQRRAHIRGQIRQERRRHESQKRFREPLTGKRAGKIASAEAGTEYDPVIRSIRGDVRGSAKREGDLGQWHDQLAADTQAAIARAQEAGSAATAATDRRLAAAGTADQGMLASLAAADRDRAALLGAPTNDAGMKEIAAGNAAREQQAIALNAPLEAVTGSFVNELGGRVVATRLRGIESRGKERSRRDKIKEDLRAAKKQKGQATVKNMQGLREGERNYVTANRAFGLDKFNSKVDAAQGARSAATAERNASTSERNAATSERSAGTSAKSAAETRRHNRVVEKQSGKNGGLTPSQRRDAKRTQRNANVTANSLYTAAKKKPNSADEWAAFVVLVGKEVGDQVAARKAVAALKQKLQSGSGAHNNPPGPTRG